MPVVAAVVAAKQNRLPDFGVGEGLVLVLVPAEAPEEPQAVGDLLLGVQAKAVLHRAESLVCVMSGVAILPARYCCTDSR